jgi:hypothetical protein
MSGSGIIGGKWVEDNSVKIWFVSDVGVVSSPNARVIGHAGVRGFGYFGFIIGQVRVYTTWNVI